jgi:hypothetical protein
MDAHIWMGAHERSWTLLNAHFLMDAHGRAWTIFFGWTLKDAHGRLWALMGAYERSWTLVRWLERWPDFGRTLVEFSWTITVTLQKHKHVIILKF